MVNKDCDALVAQSPPSSTAGLIALEGTGELRKYLTIIEYWVYHLGSLRQMVSWRQLWLA